MPIRMLIPLIVACGLFMENLDSTVLSTSLPAIAGDLHVSPISLKLALTSYLLSLAVFVPISGWVADKYGARTVFMGAIAVFTAGSALCSLAQNLPELVLYRIVQGLGGAMMVPVGRLVILRSVAKSEMIAALAWLTIPALLGPVIGPPLGGFITTYLHWRWIFYINLPIGVLGLVLTWNFITNVKEDHAPPLDKTGFALSGLGLSAFVFGLAILGETGGSLSAGFALAAAGLGLCAAYVWHARRIENPVIDLNLLKISDLQGRRPGRLVLPDRGGRHPLSLAAHAAAELRPDAIPVGHADLRRGGGLAPHEGHRGAGHPRFRLPLRADRERAH